VWDFGFVVLAVFCGVVVSAGNWTGNIHTTAARSANLAQVVLFWCFKFRFLGPTTRPLAASQIPDFKFQKLRRQEALQPRSYA
jgi:hypothetical protein